MKLFHPLFETPIEFSENKIQVLVIENKQTAANLIGEIIAMSETGIDGEFVLSERENNISFSAVAIISDFFRINPNDKKLTNKLISELGEIAVDEKYFEETNRIISEINRYIERISDDIEYDVALDEVTVSGLLKLSGIHFDESEKSLENALLNFFDIYSKMLKTKLFVIVNLRRFVDDELLESFYSDVIYKKYNLLLIETILPEAVSEREKYKIIDKDLCEIG